MAQPPYGCRNVKHSEARSSTRRRIAYIMEELISTAFSNGANPTGSRKMTRPLPASGPPLRKRRGQTASRRPGILYAVVRQAPINQHSTRQGTLGAPLDAREFCKSRLVQVEKNDLSHVRVYGKSQFTLKSPLHIPLWTLEGLLSAKTATPPFDCGTAFCPVRAPLFLQRRGQGYQISPNQMLQKRYWTRDVMRDRVQWWIAL